MEEDLSNTNERLMIHFLVGARTVEKLNELHSLSFQKNGCIAVYTSRICPKCLTLGSFFLLTLFSRFKTHSTRSVDTRHSIPFYVALSKEVSILIGADF